MRNLALVCLGGALGTGARYLVGLWAAAALGPAVPAGTLAVNLLGCLLISAVFEASLRSAVISGDLRLFLTTGVMGGLTTYSSFNQEVLQLVRRGAPAAGLAYLGTTVVGCLCAGALGIAGARVLLRARAKDR